MLGMGLALPERAVLSRGGSPPPLAARDGLAATRCRPIVGGNAAYGMCQVNSRTMHRATGAIGQAKLAFANAVIGPMPWELPGPGNCIWRAAIETPAGTIAPLTFGGAGQAVIAPGGIAFSDFSPGDLGIRDGDWFAVRSYFEWDGGQILQNGFANATIGDAMEIGGGGLPTLTDRSAGGAIVDQGYGNSVPPLAIIARGTRAKSVLIVGDSKCWGAGDSNEPDRNATPGYRGEIARAFRPNLPSGAWPDGLPFVNVASFGASATAWPAGYAPARATLYPYFTSIVLQLGFNDIMSQDRTADQTQADLQAIIDAAKAAAPATPKFWACTTTPKSSSSDGWATIANQIAYAREPQRRIHNARIRAGTLSPDFAGWFEIADAVEHMRQGIWKVTGAANGYTGDGVHETPAGYGLIEAAGAVDVAALAA